MEQLGWIENKTFSRHDLEVTDYLQLPGQYAACLRSVLEQYSTELAFQLPGSLLKRSHIRWWQAGIDAESNRKMWWRTELR